MQFKILPSIYIKPPQIALHSDKMKRTVADNTQFWDGIQLKKFSVSASISSGNFLLIKE